MKLNVAVIGGSTAGKSYLKMAYDAGRLLAQNNAVVICGGLGGVMQEVAKGVSEENGICIGLLPGHSAKEGNRYLTAALPTGIGYARNFLVVRAGDAVLAIDGANGTVSEASFAIAEGKSVVSLRGPRLKREKPEEGRIIETDSVAYAVERVLKEAYIWRNSRRKVNWNG
jgi:uncharacterized protein (TIGR00725 family)